MERERRIEVDRVVWTIRLITNGHSTKIHFDHDAPVKLAPPVQVVETGIQMLRERRTGR